MNRKNAVSFLKMVTMIGVYGGLLMPLVFIPIVIFPFVFSKLIIFQVLIGLTFPAYLILAWMEPEFRPKANMLYLAMAAYFVAMGLSVVFASDPLRAWWGNQERMNGLFTLLHFFAWLTMATAVMKTWEQWRRLLNYEVVLSGVMAIVALLQKVNKNLLLFPAAGRVGGLLDNPIYMGAYQIFNLFFLLLLFFRTSSKSLRVWYGVLAILDIGAFLAAQSRGALVGLGVGVFAFAVYFGYFSKQKKARIAVIGGALALFVLGGAIFGLRGQPFIQNSVLGRFTNFYVSETRLIAWRIAWNGFVERPVTGWGLDNFHILFNARYNPVSLRYGQYETWFDRSHNTIFDVLSMTGIIGFITFIGIYVALFYSVIRAHRKGWIDLPIAAILFALPLAYFVQNLFVFDHPAAFSMSFLLFAFVIAATRGEFVGQTAPIAKEQVVKRRGFSWMMFGVLQVLGLILVWTTSIIPFQVSRLSLQANASFGTPAGLDFAKQAYAMWTPYLDEQSFLLSRNLITFVGQGTFSRIYKPEEWYALAKQVNDEEMQRHPKNTNPIFVYARLLHEMGATVPGAAQESEQKYLATIATSPKRQQLWYGLANLYMRVGRLDDALVIYKKVSEFVPDFGEGYWMYGLIETYEKKDVEQGARIIIQSQTVTYPYSPQTIQEAIYIAEAYNTVKDKEGMKKLADKVKDIVVGPALQYAHLALRYQQAGLTEERDRILAIGNGVDPTVQSLYQQLLQAPTSTQAIKSAIAPTPPPPAPTQVATQTSRGPGPRR